MSDFKHTFLFQEGIWTTKGYYFDEGGRGVACNGETRIIHQDDLWINDSVISLLTDPPSEYKNRYELDPITDPCMAAQWRSAESDPEKLAGRFIFIHDTIFSTWEAEDGPFSGAEVLVKADNDAYINRGFVSREGSPFSSWVMELTLQPEKDRG